MVWSMSIVHSYSNLPSEHDGMMFKGWKWLDFETRFFKFLEIFCKNKGSFLSRVSSLWLVYLLSIYRGFWKRKKSEKRLIIECAFIFFQIKSNIEENLIFLPCKRLARIWQLSWAFLDSNHDIKSFLLKKYFIFIFYII